jgi:hypothetical protein
MNGFCPNSRVGVVAESLICVPHLDAALKTPNAGLQRQHLALDCLNDSFVCTELT